MKYLINSLVLLIMLVGCAEKRATNAIDEVNLSPNLSSLISKKILSDKVFVNNNSRTILLMHILYDSLGRTQIIITPTNSLRVVSIRKPNFISKINKKFLFIYNSNDAIFLKNNSYNEMIKSIIDSVLTNNIEDGEVFMESIIRIKYNLGKPYIDSLSKTMPPILNMPPKYPPHPIISK